MSDTELTKLTAQVVEAFASGNRLSAAELPALIASVHQSLASAASPAGPAPEEVKTPSPARIRQSIKSDYLVSFEDGRSYKMLTRHLRLRDLTPAQYRSKWGLPADYPMTAPSYSAKRSALAKAAGLGRKPAEAAPAKPSAAAPAKAARAAPRPKPATARKPRAAKGAAAPDQAG
jgi:predicted transcriptional regulator